MLLQRVQCSNVPANIHHGPLEICFLWCYTPPACNISIGNTCQTESLLQTSILKFLCRQHLVTVPFLPKKINHINKLLAITTDSYKKGFATESSVESALWCVPFCTLITNKNVFSRSMVKRKKKYLNKGLILFTYITYYYNVLACRCDYLSLLCHLTPADAH